MSVIITPSHQYKITPDKTACRVNRYKSVLGYDNDGIRGSSFSQRMCMFYKKVKITTCMYCDDS